MTFTSHDTTILGLQLISIGAYIYEKRFTPDQESEVTLHQNTKNSNTLNKNLHMLIYFLSYLEVQQYLSLKHDLKLENLVLG